MTTKRKIIREIQSKAPDISQNIEKAVDFNAIKRACENADNKKRNGLAVIFGGWRKYVFSGALACILVLIFVLPFVINGPSHIVKAEAYTVVLSVNPSVKFSVNKDDVVTTQEGLNEDGAILLYNKNYVGQNVGDASSSLITEMEKMGINVNSVKLSVYDEKKNVLGDKRRYLADAVHSVLQLSNVSLIDMTDDELDALEDYYEKHNVSDYEKNLITEFKQRVIKLAEKKIRDANALIEKLSPYCKDSDEIIQGFPYKEEVLSFVDEYKTECNIDFGKVKYEDVNEFCEELTEIAEELAEEIEEINEESENYGELLEDLIELVKEKLFEED